ncbi:MAG: GFA family protein [Thermoleophilaceae bacterium]
MTYSIDAEPVVQGVCHCTDCQRQTGNPFSVIVGVPQAAFQVEGDTLASFTTTGEDHGGATERNFCSACGSPIFSASAVMPDVVFVKAGSLDDASWLQPAAEVWTSSAQPWSPHFEDAVRLERGPQ